MRRMRANRRELGQQPFSKRLRPTKHDVLGQIGRITGALLSGELARCVGCESAAYIMGIIRHIHYMLLNKRSRIIVVPPLRVVKVWLNSGPHLVDSKPCAFSKSVNVSSQMLVTFAQHLVKFVPYLAHAGPNLVDSEPNWAEQKPIFVRIWPNMANFRRIRATCCRNRFTSPGLRPNLARFRPTCGPISAEMDRFRPVLAKSDQTRFFSRVIGASPSSLRARPAMPPGHGIGPAMLTDLPTDQMRSPLRNGSSSWIACSPRHWRGRLRRARARARSASLEAWRHSAIAQPSHFRRVIRPPARDLAARTPVRRRRGLGAACARPPARARVARTLPARSPTGALSRAPPPRPPTRRHVSCLGRGLLADPLRFADPLR